MSGYDEALAWFRADPERVRDLDDVDNRSAAIAIVNAVLAGAVPAGRDLTAQDVRDVLEAVGGSGPRQTIADFLNRIARGAPERGDDEPVRCTCEPCTSGGTGHPTIQHCAACCFGTMIAEYDHDCPIAEHREMAARQFPPSTSVAPIGSLPAMPPEVTEALGWFRKNPERLLDRLVGVSDQRLAATVVRWVLSLPGTGERAATEQEPAPPRSWSLPAPPPDDVAVEYRVTVTRSDGAVLTTYAGDDRYVAERMAGSDGCRAEVRTVSPWRELSVVEGEPPAPQPQEPPRFEREVESIAITLWQLWGDVSPGCVTSPGPIDQRFSDLIARVRALAAAGAVRVEEELPDGACSACGDPHGDGPCGWYEQNGHVR